MALPAERLGENLDKRSLENRISIEEGKRRVIVCLGGYFGNDLFHIMSYCRPLFFGHLMLLIL